MRSYVNEKGHSHSIMHSNFKSVSRILITLLILNAQLAHTAEHAPALNPEMILCVTNEKGSGACTIT